MATNLLTMSDVLELADNPKVSVEGVSLNQKIKEERAVRTDTKTPEQRAHQREQKSRAAVALARADRRMKEYPPGTDRNAVEAVAGTGPERPDFDLLAKTAPEKAAAEVDAYAQAYGVDKAPPAPGSDRFFKGTMNAPSDGAEIPYYTNLPSELRHTGARDFEEIHPGTTGSGLGGSADERDPRRREVVQRIRMARDQIKLGPKSDDVIAGEVSRNMDGALSDLKKLGPEEAGKKWLGMVERGELSDSAYRRLGAETAEEAKRQDESEYAKTREEYVATARETGTGRALDVINKNRKYGTSNPQHLGRIEQELRQLGRSSLDPEAIVTPNAFLPLSKADVDFFRRGGNNAPMTGDKTDEDAPPTINNTHTGKTTLQMAGEQTEAANEQLVQRVSQPDIVGKPARSAASYLLGAALGAPEPANTSGNTVPTAESALSFLEGGGNTEKGRALRKKRGKTLDETRNTRPPFADVRPADQIGETRSGPGSQRTRVGSGELGYEIDTSSGLMQWLLRGGRSK